jgi:Flp pilus assembly protein TadD
MRAAVRSLYMKSEPWAAERDFRRVLELDPQRYGAIQGLASALDATGKSGEARRLWAQALLLAKEFNDTRTVELATNKLAEGR